MTFCLTTQVTEYLTSLLFGGTDIVIHDVAGAIPSLSKCYIMLGFENGYRVYYCYNNHTCIMHRICSPLTVLQKITEELF